MLRKDALPMASAASMRRSMRRAKNKAQSINNPLVEPTVAALCLRLIFALTLLLSLSSVVIAEGKSITITLKKAASVSSSFIKLREIASLSGDSELIESAGKIMLGRKPKDAKAKGISAGKITDALMRNGIERKCFIITGAKTANVYNANFKVIDEEEVATEDTATAEKTKETIVKAAPTLSTPTKNHAPATENNTKTAESIDALVENALEFIAERTAENLKLTIEDISVSEKLRNANLRRLPKGVKRLKDAVPTKIGAVLGRQAFNLVVEIGNETFDDAILSVEIMRYAEVVVASRKLNSREAIGEDDVRIERRAFSTRAANYFTKIEDVQGMASKKSFSPNAIIIPADLEPALLIKRGAAVAIVAGVAKATGEAAEDGSLGDTIRVWRLKPERKIVGGVEVTVMKKAALLFAKVTGKDKVEIQGS